MGEIIAVTQLEGHRNIGARSKSAPASTGQPVQFNDEATSAGDFQFRRGVVGGAICGNVRVVGRFHRGANPRFTRQPLHGYPAFRRIVQRHIVFPGRMELSLDLLDGSRRSGGRAFRRAIQSEPMGPLGNALRFNHSTLPETRCFKTGRLWLHERVPCRVGMAPGP